MSRRELLKAPSTVRVTIPEVVEYVEGEPLNCTCGLYVLVELALHEYVPPDGFP